MRRHNLEHLLRAAGSIANRDEFLVIGSQAILAYNPDVPLEMCASMEADFCTPDAPSAIDVVEGSIGELSPFHEAFGYYVHGVHLDTAILAPHWEDRLIVLKSENTGGVTGRCLHPLDIAISKLAAGRKKDLEYVSAMLTGKMIDRNELNDLISQLDPEWSQRIAQCLNRI